MNEQTNPFEPPRAEIEPPAEKGAAGELRAAPRGVSAGRGAIWIGVGWGLFKDAPGTWVGMTLLIIAIFAVLFLFAGLASWVAVWLAPLFVAGWMVACHRVHTEDSPGFSDMFAGFSVHFAPLALASLIYVAASLAVSLIVGLIASSLGGSVSMMMTGDFGDQPWAGMSRSNYMLVMFLEFLLGIPVYMLMWFTPALIAIHEVPPIRAMAMSLHGCLKNILPLLVCTLLGGLVMAAGFIVLLVGVLVALPIVYCALYPAYRDIFVES